MPPPRRVKDVEGNDAIAYEPYITIYNFTKMKINIGGCVNTLSEECKDFYHKYSGDGRNYTARKVGLKFEF